MENEYISLIKQKSTKYLFNNYDIYHRRKENSEFS